MITGINESKILTKDISCKCKCKFDGRNYNSNQLRNNNKCRCECKKPNICETDFIWNYATCTSENGKYLASIVLWMIQQLCAIKLWIHTTKNKNCFNKF